MLTGPQPGDLLIHNMLNERFEIFDADGHHVAGPFETFVAARFRALIDQKAGLFGNRRSTWMVWRSAIR